MSNARHRRIPISLAVFIGGVVLFVIGVALLHLNPYWRVEPGTRGTFDHHVYLWNAVGHLVTAVGLLCVFAMTAITLVIWAGRYFTTKWLYWGGLVLVVAMVALWFVLTGISAQYLARFHWESGVGFTQFSVVNENNAPEGTRLKSPNLLWQTIVRWQIEPDLDGYLRGGQNIQRTDGDSSVTVLKLVPIAVPTALGSDGETLRNTQFKQR